MYTPDNWVVVKIITEEGPLYKVLAGWSGGYLDGDRWQLNSGIVKVEQQGDYYLFYGYSGSCYKCHKEGYCIRGNTSGVWEWLKEKLKGNIEIVPEDTDWKELFSVVKGE